MPHMTSSRMSKAPCLRQTSFMAARYPGTDGTQPKACDHQLRPSFGKGPTPLLQAYRANDGLGDKGANGVWPNSLELGVQLRRQPGHVQLIGFSFRLPTILKTRGHLRRVRKQHGLEMLPPVRMAAHGQGAERDTMIRLASRNETTPLRLGGAFLEVVLPGEFHRRLHGLRTCATSGPRDRCGGQADPPELTMYARAIWPLVESTRNRHSRSQTSVV